LSNAHSSLTDAAADQKDLVKFLLQNYARKGVDGRPVSDPSMPTAVNVSFSVKRILEFDQENQVIEIIGRTALVNKNFGSFKLIHFIDRTCLI
jgi:hypothetical protein